MLKVIDVCVCICELQVFYQQRYAFAAIPTILDGRTQGFTLS